MEIHNAVVNKNRYQNQAELHPTTKVFIQGLVLPKSRDSKSAKALSLKWLSVMRLRPIPAQRSMPVLSFIHEHPAIRWVWNSRIRAKWKFQYPPARVLYIGDTEPEAYVIELADSLPVRPIPGFKGMSADTPARPPLSGIAFICFWPSAPITNLCPKRSSAT